VGVIHAAIVVFLSIFHREILMDICDVEGDTKGGVWTLPRVLGRGKALVCACACVLLGAGVSLWSVWESVAGLVGVSVGVVGVVCMCLWEWLVVVKRGWKEEDLSKVIEWSPLPMLVMVVVMGLVGGGAGVGV
jgi:4-hydroxybenzoate polyprenyltransferase